jgi:Family of unknown function (DUF5681)
MNDTRNADGTFSKGQSGNPSGRAKLSPQIRAMLADNAEKAVKSIVKHLDDSDPRIALKAAELLLDRNFGKPQTASECIQLSDIGDTSTAEGLLKLHGAMIAGAASGSIALAEAREFSALLEGHRRLVETVELEARIASLEKAKSP